MAFFSSRPRADAHSTLADDGPVESEQSLRRRARQRLIGSVVLVSLAFGAFSLLFDNQPRAISVDVPIEIPDKKTAKPLVMPSDAASTATASLSPTAVLDAKEQIIETRKPDGKPSAATAVAAGAAVVAATAAVVALKSDAPVAPASASAIADAQARAVAAKALQDKAAQDIAAKDKAAQDKARAKESSDAQAAKDAQSKAAEAKTAAANASDATAQDAKAAALKASEQKAALASAAQAKALADKDDRQAKDAKEAKTKAEAARAKALLEGQGAATVAVPGAATPKPEAEAARYIVQFGAFSDAAKAQETRNRVERAGLKTYAQEANTADGKRIRVRVGPFATRAQADAAANKIKALDLPASVLTL